MVVCSPCRCHCLRWTAILYFVHQFSRMIWWILLHPDEVASGPKTDSNYKVLHQMYLSLQKQSEKTLSLGAHTASIYDHNAWMAGSMAINAITLNDSFGNILHLRRVCRKMIRRWCRVQFIDVAQDLDQIYGNVPRARERFTEHFQEGRGPMRHQLLMRTI